MYHKNYLSAILIAALVVEGWLTINALGGWTMMDAIGWRVVEDGFSLVVGVVASIKMLLILVSVGSMGLQTIARRVV